MAMPGAAAEASMRVVTRPSSTQRLAEAALDGSFEVANGLGLVLARGNDTHHGALQETCPQHGDKTLGIDRRLTVRQILNGHLRLEAQRLARKQDCGPSVQPRWVADLDVDRLQVGLPDGRSC